MKITALIEKLGRTDWWEEDEARRPRVVSKTAQRNKLAAGNERKNRRLTRAILFPTDNFPEGSMFGRDW